MARAGPPGTLRITLFEEAWVVALDPSVVPTSLDPELRVRMAAAPRDTSQARPRREFLCTAAESAHLLRFYADAADSLSTREGQHGVRACNEACAEIIAARHRAGLTPGISDRSSPKGGAAMTEEELRMLREELDGKTRQRTDLEQVLAGIPTGGPQHDKWRKNVILRIQQVDREIERLQGRIRALEST